MSTENQGTEGAGAGTTTTEGAAPAASGTTTTTTTQVDVSKIPDEALKDRLDRHARSVLNSSLGVKTPEEAKAMRERLAAYEKAEQERKTAEMTEAQKAMAEADAAKAKLAQLESDLAEERRTNKIQGVLHAKGIKNTDYARFLLDRDRAAAGGAEDFDYEGALSKALGDPMTRAALGIVDGTTQTPTTQVPANTSPAGGAAPKPPTAGGIPDGPKSAKAMTAEEWSAYKRANGMF